MLPKVLRADWSTVFSEVTRQILLGAGIVAVTIVLARGMRGTADAQSSAWTRRLPYADTSQLVLRGAETGVVRGSAAEMARLRDQQAQVHARAHLHLQIMSYFYARYFASVTVSAILAVAAGLCLFHIGKVGWANANRYATTAFIVTAGLTIFYQLSPKLYKQEENIAANKRLYLRYVATDNEIQTYLATGKLSSPDTVLPLEHVVRVIDQRLSELSDLPIGFDEGRVPDYGKLPGLTERQP